jgi:hypothetical protein
MEEIEFLKEQIKILKETLDIERKINRKPLLKAKDELIEELQNQIAGFKEKLQEKENRHTGKLRVVHFSQKV